MWYWCFICKNKTYFFEFVSDFMNCVRRASEDGSRINPRNESRLRHISHRRWTVWGKKVQWINRCQKRVEKRGRLLGFLLLLNDSFFKCMPCVRSNYRMCVMDWLEGTWQEAVMPCCLTLPSGRRRVDLVVTWLSLIAQTIDQHNFEQYSFLWE